MVHLFLKNNHTLVSSIPADLFYETTEAKIAKVHLCSLFLVSDVISFLSQRINKHKKHSGDKPPQTQNLYPTGGDLSSPLWLADLGVARTDLRRTSCYSSYAGVLVQPNKLRETILAAGVSRKDHLLGLAQSVKLPELSGLWLGITGYTHTHAHASTRIINWDHSVIYETYLCHSCFVSHLFASKRGKFVP